MLGIDTDPDRPDPDRHSLDTDPNPVPDPFVSSLQRTAHKYKRCPCGLPSGYGVFLFILTLIIITVYCNFTKFFARISLCY